MPDKINPATKPVGKSDGIAKGSSHSTLTTPDFDSPNGNKNWSEGTESGNLLGKQK